jgi:hypothetical protein
VVRARGLATSVRPRLSPESKAGAWPSILYLLGRILQVTGLVVTLVAATAFFGTPSTIAMLRMMLVGVLFFVPGWLLVRVGAGDRQRE